MSDLTEFLLARFDEEAANAEWIHDSSEDDLRLLEFYGQCTCGRPARVLAEVAAKRRIVQLHVSGEAWCDHCAGPGDIDDSCPTLRALASVYADHPDYRQEWKP